MKKKREDLKKDDNKRIKAKRGNLDHNKVKQDNQLKQLRKGEESGAC